MERQKYLENIKKNTGEDKYKAILNYAWFLRQKEPKESAKQAKKVLEYARTSNNFKFEFAALKYLSYAYFYLSDMEETTRWADELLKTAKKRNDLRALGHSYSIYSRIAFQQNNVNEAMENILKALDYFLQINSTDDLCMSYNGLGMIHQQRGEDTEAEHYFKLALKEAEKINTHTQHSIRTNLSNIIFKQGRYEESLKMYLRSYEYFQNNNMESSMATVLLNIGLCQSYMKDYSSALENLHQSYKLCKKINDPRELGLAANAIAHTYILDKKWDDAFKYMQEALEISEENNLSFNVSSCYSTYIKYYEERKELDLANKYLHKLVKINDKINKEKIEKNYAELEARYKTQIYKLKNAELDKKNQAMDNQIKELNDTIGKSQETYQELQKRFQETLDEYNKQGNILSTQSRMAMMGEMISSIAHQWKQPLNIIWILAQAIGEAWEFDELNEEFMQNQLERIGEQVMYMSDTINDFRNFFKDDYVCDFYISESVNKSIKLLSYIMNKQYIKIESYFEDDCKLFGNPNELVQVMVNIINNAKDAILRTKPSNPSINIEQLCNNGNAIIKISNTGEQISPEILSKMFEPYFTTRGKEGTGIGLYICKNIIENKFNGNIRAQNISNGVEFQIIIPLQSVEEQ